MSSTRRKLKLPIIDTKTLTLPFNKKTKENESIFDRFTNVSKTEVNERQIMIKYFKTNMPLIFLDQSHFESMRQNQISSKNSKPKKKSLFRKFRTLSISKRKELFDSEVFNNKQNRNSLKPMYTKITSKIQSQGNNNQMFCSSNNVFENGLNLNKYYKKKTVNKDYYKNILSEIKENKFMSKKSKKNTNNIPKILKKKKLQFQRKTKHQFFISISSYLQNKLEENFTKISSINDKFVNLQEIGNGSYATAYSATELKSGVTFVLKTFRLQFFKKKHYITRLMVI